MNKHSIPHNEMKLSVLFNEPIELCLDWECITSLLKATELQKV